MQDKESLEKQIEENRVRWEEEKEAFITQVKQSQVAMANPEEESKQSHP